MKDVNLGDTEPMQKRRALATGFPKAQRPPVVMKGGLGDLNFFRRRLDFPLQQGPIGFIRGFLPHRSGSRAASIVTALPGETTHGKRRIRATCRIGIRFS